MKTHSAFLNQILDLIEANGWTRDLVVTELSSSSSSSSSSSHSVDPHSPLRPSVRIQIHLSAHHSLAPSELVNIYEEGIHSLEQVQQECLRALRTGHSGL